MTRVAVPWQQHRSVARIRSAGGPPAGECREHRSYRRQLAKRAQMPNMTDMPGKSLALIAQPPELTHVGLAQRRPIAEETRHALIAGLPCLLNLFVVER